MTYGTIGAELTKQTKLLRKKRQRPRRAVVAWMRRNPSWYAELIALEWEAQTGEDWQTIFVASVRA